MIEQLDSGKRAPGRSRSRAVGWVVMLMARSLARVPWRYVTFQPAARTGPSAYRTLVSIPAVVAVVLLGVWVSGGLISNDFRTSMALTAAWFALSGAACLLVARRSRALRVAVLGAYVVTAAAVGVYSASTTLRDRVVHERVVTAAAPAAATGGASLRLPP